MIIDLINLRFFFLISGHISIIIFFYSDPIRSYTSLQYTIRFSAIRELIN